MLAEFLFTFALAFLPSVPQVTPATIPLAPGTYTISVQASGFTRLEQKDIVVTAGERRSVGTLALAVGAGLQVMTALREADVTAACGPAASDPPQHRSCVGV